MEPLQQEPAKFLYVWLDVKKRVSLPKTNIFAPKNGWLEYYFPIGDAYFQGRAVSFREGKSPQKWWVVIPEPQWRSF